MVPIIDCWGVGKGFGLPYSHVVFSFCQNLYHGNAKCDVIMVLISEAMER